ncbi:MAG TPA: transposase [Pirellulales bacterium]|nr:transposase [Pirellulales bacterium]
MSRIGDPILPEPLAYFLTWTTYGTWLPGDERGWVKRERGLQTPNASLRKSSKGRMSDSICLLSVAQRHIVEATVADHCQMREWLLHAVNCRSNHVHVVLSAPLAAKMVRNELKAWCTRALKAHVGEQSDSTSRRQKWWSERGSCRVINDEDSLEAAILYVRDFQSRRKRSS